MCSIKQSMGYGTVTLSRRQSEAECWSPHVLTLPESLFHVDPPVSSFLEVPVSLPFCNEIIATEISFIGQTTANYIFLCQN